MHLHLFVRTAGADGGKRGGRPGFLRRLAPSWFRTPIRRALQAACLVLFLVLLIWVCGALPGTLAQREVLDAEVFLWLDALAGVSAAIAARAWVWALLGAAAVLAACLVFPRGFCAYICPLGSLIDLVDWLIWRHIRAPRPGRLGTWRHLRFFVLAAILVAAAAGFQAAGWLAAIPLLTRGLHAVLTPALASGGGRWEALPPIGLGGALAAGMLAAVLLLGLLGRRFWCRCLCPTGALLSAAAALRLTARQVAAACTGCGKCRKTCPFEAVAEDFSTRPEACSFCQECAAVCPAGAIQFAGRWEPVPPPAEARPAARQPAEAEPTLSRRGILAGAAASAAAGLAGGLGLPRAAHGAPVPVRPPGSLPEAKFLARCVRCGSCLRACPTDLLQPLSLQHGLEGLWTPQAAMDYSGCDGRCNHCGQVCPTGAIRALSLREKAACRMGLAVVDERTCLPHAGRAACQLCVDACRHAGHEAIEFIRVGVEVDEEGKPVEDSGFLAPVVIRRRCIGCGLCQARCRSVNVESRGVLKAAAILIRAGDGRDDRIARGSYLELRRAETKPKAASGPASDPASAPATRPGSGYVTDF